MSFRTQDEALDEMTQGRIVNCNANDWTIIEDAEPGLTDDSIVVRVQEAPEPVTMNLSEIIDVRDA